MQYNWPLIGHDNVKRYFEKSLGCGRVHHAYLFEGPAQVGKATFARMLAKTLLCEGDLASGRPEARSPSIPCGRCRACIAYTHGAHPDFLALDRGEEEHISIEKAREFIAALATRPLLGSLRIGMIEEAAKLTPEAASALLKTLEEPGASVVIFLVTDRPALPTIASRCQRIKFGFVGAREMEKHLGDLQHAREIAAFAFGRPGLAMMLKDPATLSDALASVREVSDILAKDERARLLWIIEEFGGRGNASGRRERCRQFIATVQQVLRGRLVQDFSVSPTLRRTLTAREYLEANVDPRLICEYILLNHAA